MPTYVYENRDGHQVERDFPVSECPALFTFKGARYRKVVAPVSFQFGKNLKHIDKPDDEREATVKTRDYSEWVIAASGKEDGFTHDPTQGKVTDKLSIPTKDGVESKRDALRHGARPPKGIKV